MKIIDREKIGIIVQALKEEGKIIVFTNGCFDILHAGHVRYLAGARALGDCLIVGLNSDCSVRKLKGTSRPVNHQDDRAEVLAGLAAVDYVVIFDELTAESLVADVKPDIYAKGGDYTIEKLPESKVVASHGGKTLLVPEVPGRSTTSIINKMKSDNRA